MRASARIFFAAGAARVHAPAGRTFFIDAADAPRIDELIPIWIETGINVCDPIEVAAGNDIVDFRRRFGRRMAYTGSVDKRAIAKGGDAIEAELRRIEPVVRDGGFIPGCDHGVPPDISWPNFVEYSRLLARITGCGRRFIDVNAAVGERVEALCAVIRGRVLQVQELPTIDRFAAQRRHEVETVHPRRSCLPRQRQQRGHDVFQAHGLMISAAFRESEIG